MKSIYEQDLDNITSDQEIFQSFRDTEVLVTGASGFLASYIVDVLLRLNELDKGFDCQVYGLVRNLEKAKVRFSKHLHDPNLHLVHSDVTTYVPDRNFQYIIHSASLASPKYYTKDPVGAILPNVVATNNLLSSARTMDLKGFLFVSSGEVYGLPLDDSPLGETDYGYVDCTDLRACYGESKRLGENLCVAYAKQYRVPTKIARPFHSYGPGVDLQDGRVFSDFVASIVARRNIQLTSRGTATRAFCYVTDVIRGFFYVLIHGEPANAYNVGNPAGEISVMDLAQLLVQMYPERGLAIELIGVTPEQQVSQSKLQRSSLKIDKIQRLGWAPTVSLASGFRRTIEHFEGK